MALTIEIAGTDRSNYVLDGSLNISKSLEGSLDSASFSMIFEDLADLGFTISAFQLVEIKDSAATIFKGFIGDIDFSFSDSSGSTILTQYNISCFGFDKILEMRIINAGYVSKTAAYIINSLFTTYFSDYSFNSTTHIETGETLSISFRDLSMLEAMNDIAQECLGYFWYIDSSKNVHFHSLATASDTPFHITNTRGNWFNLSGASSGMNVRNRVTVKGGLEIYSENYYDDTPITVAAIDEGWTSRFQAKNLIYSTYAEAPAESPGIAVDAGGGKVAKSIGIRGIDDNVVPAYDFLYSYQNRAITPSAYVVNAGDKIYLKYSPVLQIKKQVQDNASIARVKDAIGDGDGMFDIVIKDDFIDTSEQAVQIGKGILSDKANANSTDMVRFSTYEAGFEIGQKLKVNNDYIPMNTELAIQSINISQVHNAASSTYNFLYTISAARREYTYEKMISDMYRELKKKRIEDEAESYVDNINETIQVTEVLTESKNPAFGENWADNVDPADDLYWDIGYWS